MQHEQITEKIIGCAYHVYNAMGFGYLESVYKKCMVIELGKECLRTEVEKPITVYYDGEEVGQFFADLVVEDGIIVELKSVRTLAKAHEVQLVNYLVATRTDVGLLLNFGEQKVEVKRKVRTLKKTTSPTG